MQEVPRQCPKGFSQTYYDIRSVLGAASEFRGRQVIPFIYLLWQDRKRSSMAYPVIQWPTLVEFRARLTG